MEASVPKPPYLLRARILVGSSFPERMNPRLAVREMFHEAGAEINLEN